MKNGSVGLEKRDWVSNFTLIGEANVYEQTFKIDERSEKSDWIYNQMGLGIDCGDKCGTVFAELMGGYGAERENVIYAHGKKEDGSDDFESKITVDWDDRFDVDVLKTIGDLCFITVGLEKDTKEKTFYKKFLSAYDAIAYIKEHLESGMVVNVKGNLKYSAYNGKVQVKKNITSIVLSKVNERAKYIAKFTQSVLVLKDSIGEEDKSKGVILVYCKVLDYVKEMNGCEVKGQIPFDKTFEYELDLSNRKIVEGIKNKLFKVIKGVTQINFEGEFVEGGAVVTAKEEDLPDEIKELIEYGAYTLEEALAKCSDNGNREQRMILKKPSIKLVGDEEKTPVVQRFKERYTEDELMLECLKTKTEDAAGAMNPPDETSDKTSDVDNMDWLNNLD